MTSYLIVRKGHSRCFNDILNAWNVFAIDFIDEQPGTIMRIHIPSKFCCVGLRMLKFCHPMRQTWVKTSQYLCVISPNPVGHSDKVIEHSKFALSSICELPYRLYSYLRNIQVTGPVGNSSYQAEKPVTLSVRGIVQLENEIWFWLSQMSTNDANRCWWRILTYSWWSLFPWTSTRCPIQPNTM